MPSTNWSGIWHQSLLLSAHFRVVVPLATSLPKAEQAALASIGLPLPPPSFWIDSTRDLRSVRWVPSSWHEADCACAGSGSSAAASATAVKPANARGLGLGRAGQDVGNERSIGNPP